MTSERKRKEINGEIYQQFLKTANRMSILFDIKLASEKTLPKLLSLEASSKAVVILIDKLALQNKRFLYCFNTCISAGIKVLTVIDKKISKEIILTTLPPTTSRSFMKIQTVLSDSIKFEKEENSLKDIAARINKLGSTSMERSANLQRAETKKSFNHSNLEQCLLQKQLLITTPAAKSKRLASNTTCKSRLSICSGENFKEANPLCVSRKTKGFQGRYKDAIKITGKSVTATMCNKTLKTVLKPKIKISTEEADFCRQVTLDDREVSWEKGDKKAGGQKKTDKRFSFDYITKTYVVANPNIRGKNKLIHINFPFDIVKLSSESSNHSSSVRSSYIWEHRLSTASTEHDEIDLNVTFDMLSFIDSPIPSPRDKKCIYQEPLPAFSESMCFPPVGRFSCDHLQARRPSVFNVLKQ